MTSPQNRRDRFEPHTHTVYSNLRLLDSINDVETLLRVAGEKGLKGIAITDHEFVGNAVKVLKAEKKLKESGKLPKDFKVVLGNEIYLVKDRRKSLIESYFHFLLIAKNKRGHEALRKLSSLSWISSFYDRGMERVPTTYADLVEILEEYPGCLIGSTACLGSEFARRTLELARAERAGDSKQEKEEVEKFLLFWKDKFKGDFYIEIAPSGTPDQITYNLRAIELAREYDIPVIFGTDAHYPTKEDRYVHKAYLTSKEGEREVDEFYSYTYLMDDDELLELTQGVINIRDVDEFCRNSIDLMNKIEEYDLAHKAIIPQIDVPERYDPPTYQVPDYCPKLEELKNSSSPQENAWIDECVDSMMRKGLDSKVYWERLETEAQVISHIQEQLGDCLYSYFNTFKYLIDLFWSVGSIVGPGRGSAVCYLSNYLLDITQLDPVENKLQYWRFLNKERVELPDIDIDLAPSKRPAIFSKMREKFGEYNVLQVCTFGSEKPRSVVQSSCRGYRSEEFPDGIDSDTALYLSSLIPESRGFLWDLSDVVDGNPEKGRRPVKAFIEEVSRYPGLLGIMRKIENLVCQRSQHASGVIIYNTEPWMTNAIMRSPDGSLTTQFSLDDSEYLGDTKYDLLATDITDKIMYCIELLMRDEVIPRMELRKAYDKYLHPSVLDLSDTRAWDSLSEGRTLNVFQFNSDVGLQAAKQIRPSDIIEMTMANALTRLMAERGEERALDRYERMKHNIQDWYDEMEQVGLTEEEVAILEPYYLPRYATPALQEDMMMIVMDDKISNFSLKEANETRKIVAKKKMDEIPVLKKKFLSRVSSEAFGEYVWRTVMAPQMG